MNADIIAALAASLAAVIAVWQAISARSQARSAKHQARASEESRLETERLLRAVEAQIAEAARQADAAIRHAVATEHQATILAKQLDEDQASRQRADEDAARRIVIDFIDSVRGFTDQLFLFVSWYEGLNKLALLNPNLLTTVILQKTSALTQAEENFWSKQTQLFGNIDDEQILDAADRTGKLVRKIGDVANNLPIPPAGRKNTRQEAVKPIRRYVAEINGVLMSGLEVGERTEQLPVIEA